MNQDIDLHYLTFDKDNVYIPKPQLDHNFFSEICSQKQSMPLTIILKLWIPLLTENIFLLVCFPCILSIIKRNNIFSNQNVKMCKILFLTYIFVALTIFKRTTKSFLGETLLVVNLFFMIALWQRCCYVDGSESLYPNILEKLVTGEI